MSPAAWSWLVAAVGILGAWLTGRNPRLGWRYNIAAQVVWITYGTVTGQPGLILLSVAYMGIFAQNLWHWRGTDFVPPHRTRHFRPRYSRTPTDCEP